MADEERRLLVYGDIVRFTRQTKRCWDTNSRVFTPHGTSETWLQDSRGSPSDGRRGAQSEEKLVHQFSRLTGG